MKLESVLVAPDGENTFRVIDTESGRVINGDVPMCVGLLKAITSCCRVAFVENAYHVLAAHGLLDADKREGMEFSIGRDGLPLVICQDPPTLVYLRNAEGTLLIIDPANYGLSLSDDSPCEQLMELKGLFHMHYWPGTAAAVAEEWKVKYGGITDHPETWQTLPRDALAAAMPMGGNCGASFMGQCPGNAFHLYDLNAAYLWAASQHLPTTLLAKGEGRPLTGNFSGMVADVTLKTENALYPYRPDREDSHGRKLTYYPVGEFRTLLCGMELEAARDLGHIKEIHRWEQYRTEPFLLKYCNAMRAKIASATPLVRPAAKTIALAGLGYYARKVRMWELSVKNPPSPDFRGDFFRLEDDGVKRYRCVNSCVMAESTAGFHQDSSPQVWAFIASAVRSRLGNALRRLDKHVFYWDTDSVIVDSRGAKIMEGSCDYNVPFGWKKKETAKTLHIWGYRRYSFGERLSIGLPESSREVPGGRWVWESPETWDEAMGNRHYPDGTVVERSTRIRGRYDHGVIQEDGRIMPYRIVPPDSFAEGSEKF